MGGRLVARTIVHALRARSLAIAAAAALLALAWLLPGVRHRFIRAVTTWDAAPSDAAGLPAGEGPGLAPAERVRVVLIDGLSRDTAAALPTWSAQCARGVSLTVDVGFPTVSLPVEVALWTGLTQQQTGVVFRSDRPLEPPLDRRGIPAQIAGSHAIAQSHGWIVRSLGFSHTEPPADPADHARDRLPEGWPDSWRTVAREAVASDERLVFVHVLEVDDAGHHFGHDADEYAAAARDADALVGQLVAAAPDARWFLLSDHGHLDGHHGGHGGEERRVRQVAGCIVGPGITAADGELVHVVDVARAIADSVGAQLSPASRGRPLSVALSSPLSPDQAMPSIGLGAGLIALLLLVAGATASLFGARWWLVPWWFVVALASLIVVRGVPTLSTPMTYAASGRDMYVTWLPALALLAVTTWLGAARTTLWRVVAAQLALPAGALAAAAVVSGAWSLALGGDTAPIVPVFTAAMSPLLLILAHGALVVALAVLGRTARSVFDRPSRRETPRSAPADV